jgi:glycosyltransferase involved in cell wall biosynthesis
MIKVLWWSDFMCNTGFGNVAEAIVTRLQATGKYDFNIVAINYHGEPYNVPASPYYKFRDIPIYASVGDIHNVYRFKEQLEKADYDVLFVQQDPFNMVPHMEPIVNARRTKIFKYVLYSPIDSYDLHPCWVSNGLRVADFPVVYTNFGVDVVRRYDKRLKVQAIYIGTDTNVYYPLTAEERIRARERWFEADQNDFILLNINTNQRRKDLPRTIFTWREVQKKIPSAKLCLHTNQVDEWANGYSLRGVINMYVPEYLHNRIIFPSGQIPQKCMREVIGAADVFLSTSMGEGWGMPVTEAMACMTPVVVPKHTSYVETVGANEERGFLADNEGFFMLQNDLERKRPVASLESLVECVLRVKNEPEEAKRRSVAALEWIKTACNWDKIVERWDALFTVAGNQAQYERRAMHRYREEDNIP